MSLVAIQAYGGVYFSSGKLSIRRRGISEVIFIFDLQIDLKGDCEFEVTL